MNIDEIKRFFASLTLEKALPGLVILICGFIVVKLLMKLFERGLNRSKLDRTMFNFLKAIMRILLYSLVVLIAAGSLGVDVSSLVAIISVISLAVSLAVQNVLANVVGGITLLITHPFRVGDHVRIDGAEGTVSEITLHYTKLVDRNSETLFIPNSETVSSKIRNFSMEGKRRLELCYGASYADNIDAVREALLEAAQQKTVLQDPSPSVRVKEFADSSVQYLLLVWVNAADYLEAEYSVTEAVKRIFDERKISIPFPQMDVHMMQ